MYSKFIYFVLILQLALGSNILSGETYARHQAEQLLQSIDQDNSYQTMYRYIVSNDLSDVERAQLHALLQKRHHGLMAHTWWATREKWWWGGLIVGTIAWVYNIRKKGVFSPLHTHVTEYGSPDSKYHEISAVTAPSVPFLLNIGLSVMLVGLSMGLWTSFDYYARNEDVQLQRIEELLTLSMKNFR